jgi:hypothetical protein
MRSSVLVVFMCIWACILLNWFDACMYGIHDRGCACGAHTIILDCNSVCTMFLLFSEYFPLTTNNRTNQQKLL